MGSAGRRRAGGMALVLGGLLGLSAKAIYYVFTHGSTQEARHDTFLSLDGAAWCRLWTVLPGLLLAGLLFAFGSAVGHLGRRGRGGLVIACGALAAQVLGLALQCWVIHPDRDFGSWPSIVGFMLEVNAYIPLAVGLVLLGVAARREGVPARAPSLPLLVGALVLPTVVLAFFLQDYVSTGGRTWDVTLTAIHLPLALAWMLLGWAVWADAVRPAGAR
jgi:hypothetical protein